MRSRSIRREPLLSLVLGLCALAGVAYANSFSAELFFDNATIIKSDPRLHDWSAENIRLILTKDYWWPLGSDLYRPLTTLSYLFNYAVLGSGENAISYHAVNLLLHATNAWLVLLIVWRLAGRLDTAWTAAALFVVLPVNTEAVTNVVGRADLLAALGVLASGWCYLRAAGTHGRRKTAWLVSTGLAACLAVLSKENAITVVVFVGLYDWLWRWPEVHGAGWRERIVTMAREIDLKGWVALLPAMALLFGVRWWMSSASLAAGPPFSDNPLAYATPWVGWLTAVKVLGRYLLLLVFPRTLSADYSYNQVPLYGDAEDWQEDTLAWVSLVVVAGWLAVAVRRRRARMFAWGVLWFFLALLPTSNLLVPIGSIMAERFVYLPSVGFCVVAALALQAIGRWLRERTAGHPRWGMTLGWMPAAIMLLLFAGRTSVRNNDWREELPFWQSSLAAAPNSHKTHRGHARALWNARQDETAAEAALAGATTSLAILDRRPLPLEQQDNLVLQDLATYATYKAGFLQQRGEVVAARHFHREAVRYLTRAATVDRGINDAARGRRLRHGQAPEEIADVGNHRIYVQLASAYLALEETGPAWEASLFAQRLVPDEEAAYYLAGAAAFNDGRPGDAAVQFLSALLIDAQYEAAWKSLMVCYDTLGVTPMPVDRIPSGGYSLRGEVPVVRAHLTSAAVRLVAQLEAAKRFDDAAYFRSTAVSTYHVSPEAFARTTPR